MSLVAQTSTLTVRALRELVRVPSRFVYPVAIPALQLLIYGEVFERLAELPGFGARTAVAYQAPGAIALSVMSAIGGAGFQVHEDLASGFLDRLRAAPVSRLAIVLGLVATDAIRLALQALAVLALSLALGAPLVTGLPGALAIAAVCGLFGACWSGLSLNIALRTRSAEATAASTLLVFPLYFASAAFMPDALLPPWLRAMNRVNPVNALIEGLRALMCDGWLGWPIARATIAGLAVAAITFPLAAVAFRRTTSG